MRHSVSHQSSTEAQTKSRRGFKLGATASPDRPAAVEPARVSGGGPGPMPWVKWLTACFCLLGALLFAAVGQADPVDPILNPQNGHYYQSVPVPQGIAWDAAFVASASTYNGMHGHLATITSPAENDYVAAHFNLAISRGYWLGGLQFPDILDPAAGWQWVTGEPFSFTAWQSFGPHEPDDALGAGNTNQDESRLQFFPGAGGVWNDARPAVTSPRGYLVEYEPDPAPGDPVISGFAAANPRGAALVSAPPGTLFLITGANFGTSGTVLFSGIPIPAAVATWSDTEIQVYAPTAPSYPIQAAITIVSDRKRGTGGPFTITAPVIGQDNLLANGSFEFPDSTHSAFTWGYTFGQLDRSSQVPRFFRGYTIPGWRIPVGTIDLTPRETAPAPGQGRQSVGLVGSPGAAKIEQTFFTEPGREYLFNGWLARDTAVNEARADVYLHDQFLVQLHHQGPATAAKPGWQTFSYRFRATSPQTTLTITDVTFLSDVAGTELDGLVVTPAP
jgi:hypothetical protein